MWDEFQLQFQLFLASALVSVGAVWLMGVGNVDFDVDSLVLHRSFLPFGINSFSWVGAVIEMVSLSGCEAGGNFYLLFWHSFFYLFGRY